MTNHQSYIDEREKLYRQFKARNEEVDRVWGELAAIQRQNASLREQLVQAPAIRDSAFVFGHVVGVLRLKNLILVAPSMNLASLDNALLFPEISSPRKVASMGQEEMPDAFPGQASSSVPKENSPKALWIL